MKLTPAQLDRACGAVLGSAVGDALGAPYEFGLAKVGPDGPRMIGGGLGDFEPGEWTDDTAMAWCILDVAATGADLRNDDPLTAIARNFCAWYEADPPDIGNQTRTILTSVGGSTTGSEMTAAAQALHARTGHTAGNGSLMRTAPVALPYLDDEVALAEAARMVGALTHHDPRAQDACVLWSLAIRHAIVHGEFDIRAGLAQLDDGAIDFWTDKLDQAESSEPKTFQPNGWAVTALQAAWSAIVHTPIPTTGHACAHLVESLTTAIGIGDDTDTVAAIAGALLGARWGASAIPAQWRRISHGYPGLTGEHLVELAHLAANKGPGIYNWPTVDHIDYTSQYALTGTLVHHPHDSGVWLADARSLDALPDEVTAVVSLCLMGHKQVRRDLVHIAYRLIDTADSTANPNLDFLLADAARTVQTLRHEGHVVLLHCVAAQSRTPTVAAAYAMLLGRPEKEAMEEVCAALPAARPNAGFRSALERLEESGLLRSGSVQST